MMEAAAAPSPPDDDPDDRLGRVHVPVAWHPERPRLFEVLAAATGLPLECVRVMRNRADVSLDWRTLNWHGPDGRPVTTGKGGIADVRQLWEALLARDLIPEDWADDPRRAFDSGGRRGIGAGGREVWLGTEAQWPRGAPPDPLVPMFDERGNLIAYGGAYHRIECVLLPHPPSVAVAVALASDPRGVATAEACARELAARLAPWKAATPSERVVWRVSGVSGVLPQDGVSVREAAPALATAVDAALVQMARGAPDAVPRLAFAAPCADDEYAAGVWRRAAADPRASVMSLADDVVTGQSWAPVPERVAGRRYRDLPDPFAPALDLWNLGYGFGGVLDDGAVVLVCPPVDGAVGV